MDDPERRRERALARARIVEELGQLEQSQEEERLRQSRESRARAVLDRYGYAANLHGQPFTKARKLDYLALIGAGMTQFQACRAAGVSERTISQHRRTDPKFAEDLEQALSDSVDIVEDRLIDIALAGKLDSMATVRAAETVLAARKRAYRKESRFPAASARLTQRADGTRAIEVSTGSFTAD